MTINGISAAASQFVTVFIYTLLIWLRAPETTAGHRNSLPTSIDDNAKELKKLTL
jgi:hypothetical protein